MTDKGSDNFDLIGPRRDAPAPADKAASQPPEMKYSEALLGQAAHMERDPIEQNWKDDGGSLLLALSRLEHPAGTGREHPSARSIRGAIHPPLPDYHYEDIVPAETVPAAADGTASQPASGPIGPVDAIGPADLGGLPDLVEMADLVDVVDLVDAADPIDCAIPATSIDPTDPAAPVDSIGPAHVADAPETAGTPADDTVINVAAELKPVIPLVRPPVRDDVPGAPGKRRSRNRLMATGLVMSMMVAVIGWRLTDGPAVCYPPGQAHASAAIGPAADAVARRIVFAESGGDASAKNKRSTATGAGQFLAGTWLDMIRAYRPDLSQRSEAEILDLRYDPEISREMVGRFAEQNADMLRRRCLPVTAGTLYLSHFAGGAGAVAVLSAPDHADAATTMAAADSRGRTTRSMIVTANPFLRDYTVTDLKAWADRKMRGTGSI